MTAPDFGHLTYLAYLLIWAGLVLALQWSTGGPELRARWRAVASAVILSTTYLSLADRFALGSGIWEISPQQSLGVKLNGLPLEEALFFLLTNLMVAQSVALLLARELTPGVVWARLTAHAASIRSGLRSAAGSWGLAIAAASLAALAGSLAATLAGAPTPLTAPWEIVMVVTPVPVAARLIDSLGEWTRPMGMLGAFAIYLLIGGLIGALACSGRSGLVVATGLALGLWAWLATASHPLPTGIVALGPLATALNPGGVETGRESSGRRFTRRELLVRVAPLLAASGLGLLWVAERGLRNRATTRAAQPLFDPPAVLPRAEGFPVEGQPPELTPTDLFYVVSKNVEDPSPDEQYWRLRIHGRVQRPSSINFASLLDMPPVNQYTTLCCVSNPVGWPLMSNGLWSGIPVAYVLNQAGLLPSSQRAMFRGLDGHYEDLPLGVLLSPDTLIAYGLNGRLLDRTHGYPARLVVPGHYGFKNVKWLTEIEVLEEDQPGFWPSRGWTRDGEMATVSRIDVARREGDRILLAGVAMAGTRGVSAVEVRTLSGSQSSDWQRAALHVPPLGEACWVQWRAVISRPPGAGSRAEVRAVDGLGHPQEETPSGPFPGGASGLHSVEVPA